MDSLAVWVRPDEQCVALTRDYRVIQRHKGHRYSVDDMLVGRWAMQVPEPQRAVDLGCGLGSVLLMVAWAHPTAQLMAIEAQLELADLARRNVLLNASGHRCTVLDGDLRDHGLLAGLGKFDLVTGTPPYFDPRAATPCADPQRRYAHYELRGGIEDYFAAASVLLSERGRFVVCAAAQPRRRVEAAAKATGLSILRRRLVVPRTDREAFLELVECTRRPCETVEEEPLVLRLGDRRRTQEHIDIRESFGVPSSLY